MEDAREVGAQAPLEQLAVFVRIAGFQLASAVTDVVRPSIRVRNSLVVFVFDLAPDLANHVRVSADLYPSYEWSGRTIEYHRAQIREFVGFREATVQDGHELLDVVVERTQRMWQALVENVDREPLATLLREGHADSWRRVFEYVKQRNALWRGRLPPLQ